MTSHHIGMPIHDENLRLLAWWMLAIFCLAAVGAVCRWAWRHENKWLLVVAVPPGTVLAYIAWRIAKGLAIAVYRDWFAIITTVWVVLTFYLWERGNSYRDDARREREAVERLYKERE